MSAYNWIVFDARCPACRAHAPIRRQAHRCSSYDGDTTERFFDREYRLGDAMAWWPRDDERRTDLGFHAVVERVVTLVLAADWPEGYER